MQQPYAAAPMSHAPSTYPPPPGWGAGPRAPSRNVALIVIGAVLLFLALAPGGLFLYNLWQYSTVADRWSADPKMSDDALQFGVELVQEAAMRRMVVFGPVTALFGVAGLVLGGLGLRKK